MILIQVMASVLPLLQFMSMLMAGRNFTKPISLVSSSLNRRVMPEGTTIPE